MTRQSPRAVRAPFLMLVLALAVAATPAAAASAAEGDAAWSAVPADAAGAPDGRTRFELALEPGQQVAENLLITNSSTVEREFAVYASDGFNTPTGGFDVLPAAQAPTDVGAWVTPAAPTVTIAPLSTAVVPLAITAPPGATPGDHPGGVVVSPVRTQATQGGVVVDTRVAVRLNVRVAGDVTPALEVRTLSGSQGFTAVPFGAVPATLTYEVVNTGNVKVIGVPRLRLTGPFGVEVAQSAADHTREILPGDAFTVTTVLDAVAPLVVLTAVVDVEMEAAPGPATEIPLVSASERTTMLAVPWTGLALLAGLAGVGWWLVRRARERRRAGEELWARLAEASPASDDASTASPLVGAIGPGAAGNGPGAARNGTGGPGAAGTLAVLVLVVVLGGLGLALTPDTATAVPGAARVAADDDSGSLTLTVPQRPVPPPAGGSVRAGGRSPGGVEAPAAPAEEAPAAPDDADVVPANLLGDPDLLWSSPDGRWTPTRWALVGAGAAGGLGAAGLAVRSILLSRRMVP